MGSSHSIDGFLKKLGDMGTATERQRTAAVAEGALKTKVIMLGAAAAQGVSPGGLIAGRRWGVSYKVNASRQPEALVRFTGPFHLVNNPTKAHYIAASGLGGSRSSRSEAARAGGRGAFSGKRRSSRGKRALSFNGVVRAYVFHPGTPGKGIFREAKAIALRAVPDVMAKSMSSAWKQVIG